MTDDEFRQHRRLAVFSAFAVAQVMEHNRLRGDWPDEDGYERIVGDADTVADEVESACERLAIRRRAR